ncbi:MAG TPA: hypothetical protein DCZ10_15205, partial [Pelotomaculum sp.]|nr:hypothetical protein [Pelotomaculum sp.]
PKPRYWLYLATAVIVVGLTVSVYYAVQSIRLNYAARGEFKSEQNQVPPNPPADQLSPVQDPVNKQEGVRLTFSVTKNTCWIRVIVDGAPAFQGELSAGQTQEFTGTEKISFRLGNAGVVQVQLNGQDLGFLGEEGAVIDREFTSSPTG